MNANAVEVQCCCCHSRCENDASTKWCCTLFFLLLTRWHFAQRHPSLLQSLRGARSGGTYCQRMKNLMAKQDMALENALIVAQTEVPLLGVVPLLRLRWPRLHGPWQWIVEFACRSSFGNVLFLGRCSHLALIDRASALRSPRGVRCGAAGLWFRSGPVHSARAFLLKLISWSTYYYWKFRTSKTCDGCRPTQSVMYVPLQVNRFKENSLLIVKYKYLKSFSGDFYCRESDPPHNIMQYWFYYSIGLIFQFQQTIMVWSKWFSSQNSIWDMVKCLDPGFG